MSGLTGQYLKEIEERLGRIAADAAPIAAAVAAIAAALEAGGVVQAFGTGHSEAFAMEIAGRAGGLIATNRIPLRNVVLRGRRDLSVLGGAGLEQDATVVDELLALTDLNPSDIFVIASNSGVNGSIVGMALAAKARGHKVIAVTSLAHTRAVKPKHPSGRRLSEVADIVIDNLAPYGDTVMEIHGGIGVGAVSSITAAFIAQLITIGVAETIVAHGQTPPVYLSANIPGGDEHNRVLEDAYGDRIRREA
jgi:uncharacterized phosphosugar-binding protein